MLTRRAFTALPAAWLAPVQPSILVHEHVLVNFKRASYDADVVFGLAKPKLEEIARLGCKRFLECTPEFVGRDTKLLQRLADATGVEIWTNTGLYGAREHEYIPEYAKQETAAHLAKRWVKEVRTGVNGMKPRFIKIGVNQGPLGALDRKLVEAAALCSKETGLTIASHSENGIAATEQVEIVLGVKADIGKFVWVHADKEKDHAFHKKVGAAGAWVEFDHVSPSAASLAWHLECVRFMETNGLLQRTLVSQDAGYYRPGEPGGGSFRDYATVYTKFMPQLDAGVVKTIFWENARAAFGK
jgi:phosphotriesterase-related protein